MTRNARFFIPAAVLFFILSLPITVFAANHEAQKLFDRSQFEFQDESYEDALTFIDQAIKLDPVNLKYQRFRAAVLVKLKRYGEAIAALNKVMATDPVGQKEVVIEIANTYAAMKEDVKAEINYTKAILLFPDRANLYLGRGLVYLRMKNYKRAESDFSHVAEMDPKLAAFALYHLALSSYKQGNYAQAKERLGKAVALKPGKALLESCQKFLINIKAEEKARRPAIAMVNVFLKYDSNVSNQPLESAAGVLPSGLPATDQSDWSLGGRFWGAFRLINNRRTQLGLSYTFMAEYYEHLSENDLLAHDFSLFYNRNADPLYFRISGEYAYYFANQADKMALYAINPGLIWAFNGTDRLDFLFNFQYRKMLDQTANVNHYTGALTYYHDFRMEGGEAITFRAGVKTEYERPRQSTSPDYNSYEFSTGLTFPAIGGFVPDLSVQYGLLRYDLFAAFNPSIERKDYKWEFAFKVSKHITSALQLTFMCTRTENKSNMRTALGADPYMFNRNVLVFIFSGSF